MKKLFLSICLLVLALPQSVLADLSFAGESTQMAFQPLSVNPQIPLVGDEARVTVTVYNRSTVEERGLVQIYAGRGGEQIGSNLPITVPPRGVDSVTVSWTPLVSGIYYLNARIDPISEADDPSNNAFQMNVRVDDDTDNDGVGNIEDQDDDNDGLWDYEDPCPLDVTNSCEGNVDESDNETENEADKEEEENKVVLYDPDADTTVKKAAFAPLTGELVEFSLEGSENVSEKDIVIWKFSDDQSFTGSIVQRSFDEPGEYTVVRMIISEDGSTEQQTYEFRIASGSGLKMNDYLLWLLLLALIATAGIIIYLHKKNEDKARKNNSSLNLKKGRKSKK